MRLFYQKSIYHSLYLACARCTAPCASRVHRLCTCCDEHRPHPTRAQVGAYSWCGCRILAIESAPTEADRGKVQIPPSKGAAGRERQGRRASGVAAAPRPRASGAPASPLRRVVGGAHARRAIQTAARKPLVVVVVRALTSDYLRQASQNLGKYYMSQDIGVDLVRSLISGGSVGGPLQRLVPRADDSVGT